MASSSPSSAPSNTSAERILATLSPQSSQPASSSPCESFVRKLEKCYEKKTQRGQSSEQCCIPKFQLRRCLAFTYCEQESTDFYYYGHTSSGSRRSTAAAATTATAANSGHSASSSEADTEPNTKSQCAMFQEVNCFGNPRIMKIDGSSSSSSSSKNKSETYRKKETTFLEHEKSKRRIINNRMKHRDCLEVTDKLKHCLHKHNV